MADLEISVPDDLRKWVESHVADGSHASAADYVSHLIRRDIDQDEDVVRLRAAIDEGRASGVSTRSLEDIWADGLPGRNAA
jgi:antitoxin ParD1/3/4